MPRKAGPKPELITRGAYRDRPTPCPWCLNPDGTPGFIGEANDTQSPYIACGGDPRRHQRTPLGLGVRA